MAKWRLWQDQYCGLDWNDRCEVSSPEFAGVEIDNDKIEEELLSHFVESVRSAVEIEEHDDSHVCATLTICGECDVPWPCRTHGNMDDCEEQPIQLLGYHAERV